MSTEPAASELATLLVRHRETLARFLGRAGHGLAPFESLDDLVQGVCLRALQAGTFRYQGDEPFLGWLMEIARQHLVDRHRYWSSLKRGSARVLRLSLGGVAIVPGRIDITPLAKITGPSTFAVRREQLALAARALALLSERDRSLVRWLSEDLPLAEQAHRLGLSVESTRRTGHRALERFRKTFELITMRPQLPPVSLG